MRARLTPPHGFCFKRTVLSHGWCTLAPFRVAPDGAALTYTMRTSSGGAATVRIKGSSRSVTLETIGGARAAREVVRRVLNLDLDLADFHETAAEVDGLGWIAERGAGRLLRGGCAFEDLAKLVLTTNCSWAATTRMVDALTGAAGVEAEDGSRAFPSARAIADRGERFLRDEVRAGYRAPLLAELAGEVAAGRVDLASWEDPSRDPAEVRADMLRLPGVGPYVAENMLKLIGRPRGLALDSWLRSKYARVYHGGRRVTDRTIARRYARCGEWAGLALWCDMTRDWFEGDEPSATWAALA